MPETKKIHFVGDLPGLIELHKILSIANKVFQFNTNPVDMVTEIREDVNDKFLEDQIGKLKQLIETNGGKVYPQK